MRGWWERTKQQWGTFDGALWAYAMIVLSISIWKAKTLFIHSYERSEFISVGLLSVAGAVTFIFGVALRHRSKWAATGLMVLAGGVLIYESVIRGDKTPIGGLTKIAAAYLHHVLYPPKGSHMNG